MGEWTKRAGSAVALVTAFLIAGTGTALAAPSQTGLDKNMTTGESSLTVDSPVTDAATHDISVSFQGGTYSVTDSSGTVAGPGCTQTNPTTASCGNSGGLKFIHLTGGAGPDHLQVTSFGANLTFADYVGRGGDDTITAPKAFKGPEDLSGNAGNDRLTGGSGRDFLRGGPGDDTARGLAQHDKLDGGAGNDRLYGGASNDRIFGQDGNDLLFGGPGNDLLHPGSGKDRVSGGPGRDRKIR
jgi:Ca2+-binding RTX toxin-like protein